MQEIQKGFGTHSDESLACATNYDLPKRREEWVSVEIRRILIRRDHESKLLTLASLTMQDITRRIWLTLTHENKYFNGNPLGISLELERNEVIVNGELAIPVMVGGGVGLLGGRNDLRIPEFDGDRLLLPKVSMLITNRTPGAGLGIPCRSTRSVS